MYFCFTVGKRQPSASIDWVQLRRWLFYTSRSKLVSENICQWLPYTECSCATSSWWSG